MHAHGTLNPCPQCGAKANRFTIGAGALLSEIIACSVGCGYPWRMMPHVRSEWMAAAGWTDLAAMWNSCAIKVDDATGTSSLCWGNGPAYKEAPEVVGPYNPWSPAISRQNAADREVIAKVKG